MKGCLSHMAKVAHLVACQHGKPEVSGSNPSLDCTCLPKIAVKQLMPDSKGLSALILFSATFGKQNSVQFKNIDVSFQY